MTQQINLYETRLRPRVELATARNLAASAVVLLVVMTVLAVYVRQEASRKTAEHAALQIQLQAEQERVAALTKMVAERRVAPELTSDLARTRTMLATRSEVMDVLDSGKLGNASGFSEFMYGFARQAQTGLWLTGFSISTGGEEIEIRGRLLDPAKLPGYVQRLSSEPVFKGRRFATLDMRSVEPELPKAEAEGVVKAAAPVAGQPPVVALPRYVEFALRSAHAVGTGVSAPAGGKP